MASAERLTDLTGWKEIAAHLGRSVRSVQRWERELGLPVRRVRTQTAEVVFARREEIDAWLAARSANGLPKNEATDDAENPAAEPSSSRRRRGILACFLLGTVAVTLVAGSALVARRPAEPARWAVEDGVLVVRDIRGGFLWAHRFDQPVDPSVMQADQPWLARNRISAVTFADLEGDGTTEVLAALLHDVYCFENGGRLRFRHAVRRSVRFGDETYGPEFTALAPVVVPRVRGASIWVASVNAFFPAVVHKLDTRGRVLGEYWLAGHPAVLRELVVGGKRVLAIGGTANESHRATLSILDPENPTATAPATVERYRCRDCPGSHPFAFLTFPSTDLSRVAAERSSVYDIVPSTDGLRVLLATAPPEAAARGLCGGDAHYTLDSRFRPVRAEFGDAYTLCHAQLRAKGLLDHHYGLRDEAELFPVQAWYGGVAERIDGPAPAGRASAK
jgi:hypothetical protein